MDLSGLLKALESPSAYPHQTKEQIEIIQTQMSVIFLTGDYVYKLKKPVDLGYVNYTTLQNRKYFCNQEVRLNRRLAPNVYLGVEPVTLSSDGKVSVGGNGDIIDYVVKMNLIPHEKCMDYLLEKDAVTPEMMRKVADVMSDFHSKAESSDEISKIADLDTLKFNIEENFTQLAPYIGRVFSQRQYDNICSFTRGFVDKNGSLLVKRNKENKVRDCHGDLHAQHICFDEPIFVFDCIEFNERFRCVDVASEVSFLCMDLDHSGHGDLALEFLKEYINKSGDTEIYKLNRFFKCYYACVRAKVNCFQLDDKLISEDGKKKCFKQASSYINLAESYSKRPKLIINYGTVACGKSKVSKELAKELGLVYISSDITRKNLANVPIYDHKNKELNTGLYGNDQTAKTYSAMFSEAENALTHGYSVILDASFLKRSFREEAHYLAKKTGSAFYCLKFETTEEQTRINLEKRSHHQTASDGSFDVYKMQLASLEEPDEIPASSLIIVSSMDSLGDKIIKILDKINDENI
jgi:aminoglycoside phosphotransferase family enzyme/gluconate kinase